MEDYRDKQRRLDLEAKRIYEEAIPKLTTAQKRILQSKECEPSFHGSSTGQSTSGLSIFKTSQKQEPSSRRLYYDDGGSSEVAEDFDYASLDTREDLILECIKYPGQLPAELRRNLKALLKEMDLKAFHSYASQLFVKFANRIRFADNPKLEIETILKAGGVTIEEAMMNGECVAKEYGVTRQAISKKTITHKNKLGLPDETRDSKAKESRAVYQKKNHRPTKI